MNSRHAEALNREIDLSRSLLARTEYDAAMIHLERAHVLGQMYLRSHALVHGLMFRAELGRREPVAALGQLVRIVFGAVGNIIGVLPTGNTGGSNVNMFQKMPVPAELARLMEDDK